MSERIYRVREDEIPGIDGEVIAVHRWGLPGLRDCASCGLTWSGSGRELPSVDISLLGEAFRDKDALRAKKRNVAPIGNMELEHLMELVRPYVPKNIELSPGSDFGPLIGRATWPLADFATTTDSASTFLAQTHVVAEMEAAGLGVKTVKAQLEFEGGEFEDLYELEALPLVHVYIPDELLARRCQRCGRIGATVPERLTVYSDTWPEGADLVRAVELPTVVFCSAKFRDVVFENGWLGIRFEDVDVVTSRFRRV